MLINGKSSIIRSLRDYWNTIIWFIWIHTILFLGTAVHVHLEAACCYTIQLKNEKKTTTKKTSFSRHWKQKETEMHILVQPFGHILLVWIIWNMIAENNTAVDLEIIHDNPMVWRWTIGGAWNEPTNTKWLQNRKQLIQLLKLIGWKCADLWKISYPTV